MTTLALSDLRNSLDEHLKRIRNGEEVMLTDQGIPVARIVPLPPVADEDADVAELIRSGQIRPAETKLSKRFIERLLRIEDPEGQIRKYLQEERDSGW